MIRPRIDVVTRDAEEMGRRAAVLALEMIRGAEPRSVIVPTGWEVRETSRPVPREIELRTVDWRA